MIYHPNRVFQIYNMPHRLCDVTDPSLGQAKPVDHYLRDPVLCRRLDILFVFC